MSEYLANSVRGYGFGYSETDALARMASHVRHDSGDGTLEVTIVRYEVDSSVSVHPGGFDIDGEVKSARTYAVPDEKLDEIAELSGELDLLVDSTLADADEVDQ